MYMPTEYHPSFFSDYLNILGELEGLLILSNVMLIFLLVILMLILIEVELLQNLCSISCQT